MVELSINNISIDTEGDYHCSFHYNNSLYSVYVRRHEQTKIYYTMLDDTLEIYVEDIGDYEPVDEEDWSIKLTKEIEQFFLINQDHLPGPKPMKQRVNEYFKGATFIEVQLLKVDLDLEDNMMFVDILVGSKNLAITAILEKIDNNWKMTGLLCKEATFGYEEIDITNIEPLHTLVERFIISQNLIK